MLHPVYKNSGSLPDIIKRKCDCGTVGQQKWLGRRLGKGFGEVRPSHMYHATQGSKATKPWELKGDIRAGN